MVPDPSQSNGGGLGGKLGGSDGGDVGICGGGGSGPGPDGLNGGGLGGKLGGGDGGDVGICGGGGSGPGPGGLNGGGLGGKLGGGDGGDVGICGGGGSGPGPGGSLTRQESSPSPRIPPSVRQTSVVHAPVPTTTRTSRPIAVSAGKSTHRREFSVMKRSRPTLASRGNALENK